MDPISIITLTATATEVVYKTSVKLYTFIQAAKSVDSRIEALAQEITGVRRVLDGIGLVFTSPVIRSAAATSSSNAQIWAAVAESVKDCLDTVARFDRELQGTAGKRASKNFFAQSVRWVKLSQKLPEVDGIRLQMGVHAQNLSISLQLVNILATTLSQDKASTAGVGKSYLALESALSELDVAEEPLISDPAQTELRRHTKLVRSTALAVLSCTDGRIALSPNDAERKQYVSAFKRAVTLSAIPDSETDSLKTAVEKEDEEAGEEPCNTGDEVETIIVETIMERADKVFHDKKYDVAERLYRDAFRHLRSLSRYPSSIDLDSAHLRLSTCCMHQDRWQEAELLLSVFVRDLDAGSEVASEANHLLAQVHLCLYDFETALIYCRRALDARKRDTAGSAYQNSARLQALIHQANGDQLSSEIYASKLPLSSPPLPQYILSRWTTYSTLEHLQTTLSEKATAIETLIRAELLPSLHREGLSHIRSIVPHYDPSITTGDAAKCLRHAISTKNVSLATFTLALIPSEDLARFATTSLTPSISHSPILRLLLASGADPVARDTSERLPLHWAAQEGYLPATIALVEAGPSSAIDGQDKSGWTPLANAAAAGQGPALQYLLSKAANTEIKTLNGDTALQLALRDNKISNALVLIAAGADIHTVNEAGESPIHRAADLKAGADEVIRSLVAKGADVNAVDDRGYTALRKLVNGGRLQTIRFLLERGADPDLAPWNARNCVCEACDWGHADVLGLLLEFGGDPKSEFKGTSALSCAESNRYEGCVALLRKKLEIVD